MEQIRKFDVYEDKKDRRMLFTKNLTPGKAFFEESLVKLGGAEFRAWDVTRSKLAAAVKKGISQIGLKQGDVVLYLGASHGYTPSFVSDIVGKDGFVFCLDVAPRVVRDLVFVCEARDNMAPMMKDANHPEQLNDLIASPVDVVYQDIAQRNQLQIFLKNCDAHLKRGGFGLLAVKARSIDVSKRPKEIFFQIRKDLEQSSMTVVDYRELDPFERDHCFFVCKKK